MNKETILKKEEDMKERIIVCSKCKTIVKEDIYPDIPDSMGCECQADFQSEFDGKLWVGYIAKKSVIKVYEELSNENPGIEGIEFLQDVFENKIKSIGD